MRATRTRFERGTLWQLIVQATKRAQAAGALHQIPTTYEYIEQAGALFLVRVIENLERKRAAGQRRDPLAVPGGSDFNPFLPYDANMYVADASASHVCLLNKYNVVDHHLLIVTRAFEEQLALLTYADFEALVRCMREFPSLGFYNAGEIAGASQRHKHLQLVPLPLAPKGPAIPIEALLDEIPEPPAATSAGALPFQHALARSPAADSPVRAAAAEAHERYLGLLRELDLIPPGPAGPNHASSPYNLLVAPSWMLLVPRSRECLGRISINALGFAGTLLARNVTELKELKSRSPLALLEHAGIPRRATASQH